MLAKTCVGFALVFLLFLSDFQVLFAFLKYIQGCHSVYSIAIDHERVRKSGFNNDLLLFGGFNKVLLFQHRLAFYFTL